MLLIMVSKKKNMKTKN